MTHRGRFLLAWVLLLVASNAVRLTRGDPDPAPGENTTFVPTVGGAGESRIAGYEWPGDRPDAPVVLLVHGSPGDGTALSGVARALPSRYRRLSPDLPGFGASSREIPDYSSRAHAAYLLAWMDRLGIARAHLVVHSLGGAVALEMTRLAPDRVASISMLAAVGVQELELSGRYDLNHALHGLQLQVLRAATWGLPHFGLLDDFPLNVAYARNFYDTDQRPLRAALRAWKGPMRILHGVRDMQVPVAAAREHHRLVPQSELREFPDESHFFVFTHPDVVAADVSDFVDRVEAGHAPVATPEREAEAEEPFDPASVPPARGASAAVLATLLAVGTLVSEDLSCLTGGLMVATGRLGLPPATLGCFLGIFAGDLLLVVAGRVLGRAALRRAPLSWWISEAAVERASAWYARNGPAIIFSSRFMPGMRLPMYFAAGTLDTPIWRFVAWFALAAGVWTPLLVGGTALAGEPALAALDESRHGALLLVAGVGTVLVLLRTLVPLATWRGRRLALSRWRRWTRWEYWPMWLFYPPVLAYGAFLALRHRSPTLFTAANPGMPASGVVGESKWDIYRRLGLGDPARPGGAFLPDTRLLRADAPDRLERASDLAEKHGYPIVLKPDAGQRGDGVAIVRSREEIARYLAAARTDVIAQQWIPGHEYGLFYVRDPGAERGRLFSITHKVPLDVVGDGKRTVEELILAHHRAVDMATRHLAAHAHGLADVPAAGEIVRLQELGTHSRGSIFLDGTDIRTPELEAAVDAISRAFDGGFRFGRYDVRAPSLEDLRAGRDFRIIELNGVTSEATHIYDPQNRVWVGWRTLFEQWRLAFAIGAENAANGAPVTPLRELWRAKRAYDRETKPAQVAEGAARAAPVTR